MGSQETALKTKEMGDNVPAKLWTAGSFLSVSMLYFPFLFFITIQLENATELKNIG